MAGQNGVDMTMGNTGCSTINGAFTVLELATDGSGAVTAAAVDFEIHCESQPPAVFGRLRFQSSQGYRGVKIDPWPYPPPLGFASTVVGSTATRTVSVSATGTEAVTISAVDATGADFSIDDEDCTTAPVASGATCTIVIAFTPSAVGLRSGTLSIDDDALAGGHEFDIAGMGLVGGFAPGSLDFGEVDMFTPAAPRTFTLHTGPSALTGIAPSMIANSGSFAVAATTCGTTLAPGASCTFSIRYRPEIVGPEQAAFFVQTNELGQLGGNVFGIGLAGTNTTWSQPSGLGTYRWNAGAGLAMTATSTASYLHAGMASAVVGSKPVKDTGPFEPVLYRRSSNGGKTWTLAFRLNPATQHGDRPSVAGAGAYVYTTWVRLKKVIRYSHTAPRVLYFRANRANGLKTKWGSIHRLSSVSGRVDYPVVAGAGNSVYVVWTNGINGAIRIAISRNHGATWHTTTLGTTTNRSSDGREGLPWIGVSGSRVTVAWVGNASGAIVARTSTSSGTSWLPAETLSSASDGLVSAATLANRSAVAWSTGRTVHVRIQSDATWASDTTVSPPGIASYFVASESPVVALQGDTDVGVAWSACVSPCGSKPKIDLIWAESPDGGAAWNRQDIGWYGFDYGDRKRFPSVVWATPTKRYVMWNAAGGDGPGLWVKSGSGPP